MSQKLKNSKNKTTFSRNSLKILLPQYTAEKILNKPSPVSYSEGLKNNYPIKQN